MNICLDCGSENRPEARFCRVCGFPVSIPTPADPGQVDQVVIPTSVNLEASTKIFSADEKPQLAEVELVAVETPADPPSDIATLPVQLENTVEQDNGVFNGGQNPTVLPIETVLQNRFRIRKVLEASSEETVYEAEDLLSCWSCHALQSTTEARFCQNCGAELAITPLVNIRSVPVSLTADLPVEAGGFIEGENKYLIVEEQLVAPEELPAPPAVRLVSGFQSHPGGVRENNEDSLVAFQLAGMCEKGCPTALGLFAVADGVGGSQSGELASKAAIEGLTAHIVQMICLPELLGAPVAPDRLADELKQAVEAANRAILALHEQLDSHDMGCTMTAALVSGRQAVVANVGDSRTYLMRDGHLTRITQDHSLVARMVEQGVLHEDEVYSHQYRNIILRSLGFQADLEVDLHELELLAGDRLLLCSDGLWETLRDPLIEDILLEPNTPQQTCDRLISLASSGDDNISLVIVDVQA